LLELLFLVAEPFYPTPPFLRYGETYELFDVGLFPEFYNDVFLYGLGKPLLLQIMSSLFM
jgi:hypothetical protein